MRVVIDTNVLVSSFFGGNPRKVIDRWKAGRMTFCLSKDILDEYVEVFERMRLGKAEIAELLSLFARGYNSLFTTRTPKVEAIKKDPGDNKFIEGAMALKAEIIITGDKHLAELKEYLGIKIETPRQFLEKHRDDAGTQS